MEAVVDAGRAASLGGRKEAVDMKEPVSRANQARDPICGMNVDIHGTRFKVSHGERMYHFCSPECQRIFERREQGLLHVKDIMSTPVKTIGIEASILDAVRLMDEEGIGSLVVVRAGKPVGIVTDRDALHAIANSSTDNVSRRVETLMSSPLVTVTEHATTEDAARIMNGHRVKYLPVLREEGIVGMITSTDLVQSTPFLVDTLQELIRARFVPDELRSQRADRTFERRPGAREA